ncbi:unnamed protein product [Strongylus vulgaris]|uniref:Uncharacterized protein n=1 Tax=Strongylus vulgaris TaxID=40348 RepID=A0A3P7JH64_STRVU|nr:unnamed protein product [Strongylus vulgaris]
MNRKEPEDDYALFLTAPEGEAQIPNEVIMAIISLIRTDPQSNWRFQISLVPIVAMCQTYHRIVIRSVDSVII